MGLGSPLDGDVSPGGGEPRPKSCAARRGVPQPERGPSIPAAYARAAPNQRPDAVSPTASQNFFSTLQSNGRVYNLNMGQTLTPSRP